MVTLSRRLLRSRFALPTALLGAVAAAAVLSMGTGAGAAPRSARTGAVHRSPSASTSTSTSSATAPATPKAVAGTAGSSRFVNTKPSVTPGASSCKKDAQRIGYKSPKNSGSPQNSQILVCSHGQVVRYGSKSILYVRPPASFVSAGHKLFEESCSSCHMATAQGSSRAPSLIGVGPATVDFWVATGRMPAATTYKVQAAEKPPRFSAKQAKEIAAWVNSLTPSAPYIPVVNVKQANLAKGASLFALNCAACHTITGAGDALAYGTYAPALRVANASQVAEAMRTGPGNMPRFTGNLSDAQVADVVAYVTEKIQHPSDGGGFGLGGVGPVAEGFVALLFGVGGLLLVAFWIGDRSA